MRHPFRLLEDAGRDVRRRIEPQRQADSPGLVGDGGDRRADLGQRRHIRSHPAPSPARRGRGPRPAARAATICPGMAATRSRLRRTTGVVTSITTPAAASARRPRSAAAKPPGLAGDRVRGVGAPRHQLDAGDGETGGRAGRARVARRVERALVSSTTRARSLRRPPHEIRQIAPQGGLPAGQHDLSGLGALRLRDAPPDRRPAHELRRPRPAGARCRTSSSGCRSRW